MDVHNYTVYIHTRGRETTVIPCVNMFFMLECSEDSVALHVIILVNSGETYQ